MQRRGAMTKKNISHENQARNISRHCCVAPPIFACFLPSPFPPALPRPAGPVVVRYLLLLYYSSVLAEGSEVCRWWTARTCRAGRAAFSAGRANQARKTPVLELSFSTPDEIETHGTAVYPTGNFATPNHRRSAVERRLITPPGLQLAAGLAYPAFGCRASGGTAVYQSAT